MQGTRSKRLNKSNKTSLTDYLLKARNNEFISLAAKGIPNAVI